MRRTGIEPFVAFWTRRPDWRDATQYPPADAPLQVFGREFSRRRDGFAEELRQWVDTLTESEIAEMAVDDDGGCRAPFGFAEVLGMDDLNDAPRWPRWILSREGQDVWAEPMALDTVTLVFDLKAPLDAQLERASSRLRASQTTRIKAGQIQGPGKARHHAKRLPLYLRVLDARTAGATFDEIAFELQDPRVGASEGLARKWYVSARRYANGGYRLLLPETRTGK